MIHTSMLGHMLFQVMKSTYEFEMRIYLEGAEILFEMPLMILLQKNIYRSLSHRFRFHVVGSYIQKKQNYY